MSKLLELYGYRPQEARNRLAELGASNRDYTTADVYNVPVRRGGVLPVTEYIDRTELDLSSGLTGAIADVVTAPDRAARREISEDQMVPEAFKFAGSLTLGGLLSPKPANTVGIFGGRLAKTADQAALAKAEQMAASGAPREQIWNETGWFQGPDKQWRFEIDDSAAAPRVKDSDGPPVMADLMTHDKLAAAYPQNMRVPVSLIPESESAKGRLSGDGFGFNESLSPRDFRSTALHENQHFIQQMEGFSGGGSPDDFLYQNSPMFSQRRSYEQPFDTYRRLAGEVEARAVQARRNMTNEQRMERAPWLDYDVPESDQIIMANAKTGAAVPLATKALEAQQPQGIRAFHGSPHNYKAERLIEWPDGRTEYIEGMPDVLPDVPQGARVIKDFPLGRQRLDKIGTGEGAQAYGHGLYEAGAEGTALTYKNAGLPSYVNQRVARHVSDALKEAGGNEKAALDLLNTKALGVKDSDLRRELFDAVNNFDEARNSGHMYEVNIKADPESFIDYDRPLGQQSEAVRRALDEAGLMPYTVVDQAGNRLDFSRGMPKAEAERFAAARGGRAIPKDDADFDAVRKAQMMTGRGDAAQADIATALREAGIPGVRYLDQMSRGAGEGSYNYVIFDDAIIDIVKKYGLAGAVALGALSQSDAEAFAAQFGE